MATKSQQITTLYSQTIKQISKTPASWINFLHSACRNYKCRFDEQVLIFGQRPDATAVLEIEKWNRQFRRWVNTGAKGIAVFDGDFNGKTRLKHYFDISDTHPADPTRPVPIWIMPQEYETEVIETLENAFGILEDNSSLAAALLSTAENAVSDNMSDYLSQLMDCREDSLLEEYDALNMEVKYKILLINSVAFMLMVRCGIDTEAYFDREDFIGVTEFNTQETMNLLGTAASDITEMGLSLNVPGGIKLALVGKSGCGKTTLGFMMIGFYAPQLGDCTL